MRLFSTLFMLPFLFFNQAQASNYIKDCSLRTNSWEKMSEFTLSIEDTTIQQMNTLDMGELLSESEITPQVNGNYYGQVRAIAVAVDKKTRRVPRLYINGNILVEPYNVSPKKVSDKSLYVYCYHLDFLNIESNITVLRRSGENRTASPQDFTAFSADLDTTMISVEANVKEISYINKSTFN